MLEAERELRAGPDGRTDIAEQPGGYGPAPDDGETPVVEGDQLW